MNILEIIQTGFLMEKDYINGVKINIIKEIILMELKKEKEKLNFLMEKNLFAILKMEK